MTNGNDPINGQVVTDNNGIFVGHAGGLTKREYFAAMAMQGLLAHGETVPHRVIPHGKFQGLRELDLDVHTAVEYADALIAALNKE